MISICADKILTTEHTEGAEIFLMGLTKSPVFSASLWLILILLGSSALRFPEES